MALIKWFNNQIRPHLILCSSFSNEYYIPEEILIQILVKLPADQVQLCKTVCRLWESTISSPYFRNRHVRVRIYEPLNHHNNISQISVFLFTTTVFSLELFGIYDGGLGFGGKKKRKMKIRRIYDILPKTPPELQNKQHDSLDYLRLIGSWDGLLIFDKFRSFFVSSWMTNRCWILVLNPITGEGRVIEYPRGPLGYVCGFFFDRYQYQHNLLHVSVTNQEYHIFSFLEGVWRRITPSSSLGHANYCVPPCMHTSPPVLVSDALHWIVDHASQVLHKSVMAFKIETKEIHYFPHPILAIYPEPRTNYFLGSINGKCDMCSSIFEESEEEKMQLIEKNGKLCFCHMINQYSMIDIWILEEYGDWSSWVRRFKVVLPQVTIREKILPTRGWGPTILSFPHEDVIAVKWNRDGIYLYHLVTHKSSSIDDHRMFARDFDKVVQYRFTAFNYTLLSPGIM